MQNAGPLLPSSSLSSQPARPGNLALVWVLLGRLLRTACGGVKPKTNSSGRGGCVSVGCNSTFICLLTASTQNARVCLQAPVSVAAELLTPGVCKTPGLWPL